MIMRLVGGVRSGWDQIWVGSEGRGPFRTSPRGLPWGFATGLATGLAIDVELGADVSTVGLAVGLSAGLAFGSFLAHSVGACRQGTWQIPRQYPRAQPWHVLRQRHSQW